MATEAIRRTRHALLVFTLFAVSACVHLPGGRESHGAANGDRDVTSEPPASVPPAGPSSTYPEPETPPAAQTPATSDATATPDAATSTPEQPTQVAGLTPAQYSDLFDRMRAGFKLEDSPDRRATDQQLNWFASNPDYLERAFGRAELYMYHIVTELESRGMPLELALLPVVESAFEPYAYSRASAAGMWQFIPETGSRFGLKQDWWYDGRRDIVESTRAALDYLQSLHDEFNGDWLLAIAAYNCGELNVERAIDYNKSQGRPIDFFSLRLPRETQAYVPKLLAMKRLISDPEAYGLAFSPIPNQPYFTRVETKGQINLKIAAEIAGVTPEEVYELNPAFHRWATDPTGPNFLLLPVDAAPVFTQNIGQLTEEQRLGATHYTVRRGDSVVSIAKHFNTTVNVVRELNDVPTGRLTVGTDLRLPSPDIQLPPKVMLAAARVDGRGRAARRPHMHVVRAGDSLWAIARRHGMNVNTLAMMNGMHPGDTLRAGQRIRLSGSSSRGSASTGSARHIVYTVRTGDTLTQIAKLFQVTVSQILAWNGMSSHTPILAGQKLTIRLASRRS